MQQTSAIKSKITDSSRSFVSARLLHHFDPYTRYKHLAFYRSTSQTVYGAPTTTTASGSTVTTATANLTSKTNYGTNPELGLAQSVTTDSGDSTHLNLTATSSYEPATAPTSYLRQTSSSLPGGATTSYSYYGPTETRANPCDTSQSYRQGGMLRLKTEPDPDGSGSQTPRTTETVYDDSGKVVATRYNSEPWTCTTYDGRERVLTTTVPAYNAQPARTITNSYAVNGNPLITSSNDTVNGVTQTITVETDLLGRNVKYTDGNNNVTLSAYDSKGHLVTRSGPLGSEEFTYDSVDRLVSQKLDGTTYATITYDSFSRITSVDYPNGQKLTLTREPDGTGSGTQGLGRVIGRSYSLPTGQPTTTLSDTVTRAVTGDITSGTELGQTKSYSYDTVGRLTSATVGSTNYTYGYGAQDSSCAGKTGVASDLTLAGKDSNRTSQTITNPSVNGGAAVSSYSCYDQADRLVYSSDPTVGTPVYDTHGNTTKLGVGSATQLELTYDSSDRNSQILQVNPSTATGTAVQYARDVQGRVKQRRTFTITNGNWQENTAQQSNYGFTASGDTPDFVKDSSGTVVEKYLTLPGDVMVTIRPGETDTNKKTTYSLPNIHGDIFATTNASGTVQGTFTAGPFGEQLNITGTNQTLPILPGQPSQPTANTPNDTRAGTTYQYVGQHQKLTETGFVLAVQQMGARVYVPGLGRFLSVDPTPGGTPNLYAYTSDPLNEFDLDGNWPSFKSMVKWTTRIAVVASFVPGPIGMIGSGVAAAGYVAQGQYGKAAASMVGFIPGGALASKVAAKSSMGAKILTKVIDTQAKAKGIGVNSKVFGYAAHGTSSFTNKVLPKVTGGYLRAGWAQGTSRGSVAWRVGVRNTKPIFVPTSYKLKRFR